MRARSHFGQPNRDGSEEGPGQGRSPDGREEAKASLFSLYRQGREQGWREGGGARQGGGGWYRQAGERQSQAGERGGGLVVRGAGGRVGGPGRCAVLAGERREGRAQLAAAVVRARAVQCARGERRLRAAIGCAAVRLRQTPAMRPGESGRCCCPSTVASPALVVPWWVPWWVLVAGRGRRLTLARKSGGRHGCQQR